MVVDCRRSTCYFRDPHDVSLASGDALGRIEIHQGEELHILSADLKDAFYHLGLPMMLRRFFGLRPVLAKEVNLSSLNGVKIPPNSRLFPMLSVIPMG